MDWMTLLGGVTTAASGGVLGMVGAFGSAIIKMFQVKADRMHQLALMKQKVIEAKVIGSYQGLDKSIEAQTNLVTYRWVNALRSLFRPILTVSLLWVSFALFNQFIDALTNQDADMSKYFTAGELLSVVRYIVYSLVFSTATAIA